MFKPITAKPLPHYRLWLRYEDGIEGIVDLSDFAGRGVFAAWQEPGVFERVEIGENGALRWGEDMELCPDATYLRLTGKAPEDVFPALKRTGTDA